LIFSSLETYLDRASISGHLANFRVVLDIFDHLDSNSDCGDDQNTTSIHHVVIVAPESDAEDLKDIKWVEHLVHQKRKDSL
jgi:hypothetical protein